MGHSRSLKVAPVDTTSYQSVIVTIALSCIVLLLLMLNNITILKSRIAVTQDHLKWRHLTDCIRLPIGVP